MNVDEFVRVAIDGGYNLVSIRAEIGKHYLAVISHRGHSGPSTDRVVFELTEERYLVLNAQMRSRARVAFQSTYHHATVLIGARYFEADGPNRRRSRAHSEVGAFLAGGISLAYDLTVESIGQESWVLHLGYTSGEQLERWAKVRSELPVKLMSRIDYRKFLDDRRAAKRDAIIDDDDEDRHVLAPLWRALDSRVDVDDFDIEAFVVEHQIPLLPEPRS